MGKQKKRRKNIGITIGILTLAFFANLFKQHVLGVQLTTPSIFVLAVFMISRYTDGYFYGIAASLVSMFTLNFVFVSPYFKLDFNLSENTISSVVMLCVSIMTSITMTKLKEQEAIRIETEKEKMRANLLRAISHDIRTPLTTIYGSCTAVIENFDILSKEQIIQLLSDTKEDAQWLIGMVENLLSITRIRSEGVKLVKKSVVLEELIDSVIVKFKKRYPHQAVIVEIPEEFVMIPMDAVLITQVLVNMLENAIEHAKGMKNVILRVKIQEEYVIFQVIDDGCGIPKERLKKIFTGDFEPGNLPADSKKHDMGIGLSVCAAIVRAHGGEITAENRKEGGSCFQFTLKMEEESYEQQQI